MRARSRASGCCARDGSTRSSRGSPMLPPTTPRCSGCASRRCTSRAAWTRRQPSPAPTAARATPSPPQQPRHRATNLRASASRRSRARSASAPRTPSSRSCCPTSCSTRVSSTKPSRSSFAPSRSRVTASSPSACAPCAPAWRSGACATPSASPRSCSCATVPAATPVWRCWPWRPGRPCSRPTTSRPPGVASTARTRPRRYAGSGPRSLVRMRCTALRRSHRWWRMSSSPVVIARPRAPSSRAPSTPMRPRSEGSAPASSHARSRPRRASIRRCRVRCSAPWMHSLAPVARVPNWRSWSRSDWRRRMIRLRPSACSIAPSPRPSLDLSAPPSSGHGARSPNPRGSSSGWRRNSHAIPGWRRRSSSCRVPSHGRRRTTRWCRRRSPSCARPWAPTRCACSWPRRPCTWRSMRRTARGWRCRSRRSTPQPCVRPTRPACSPRLPRSSSGRRHRSMNAHRVYSPAPSRRSRAPCRPTRSS